MHAYLRDILLPLRKTAVFYLFKQGSPPPCEDAADADDKGTIGLPDAIYILYYLFKQGPPPPRPFPECGIDLTQDELGCESYAPCEAGE